MQFNREARDTVITTVILMTNILLQVIGDNTGETRNVDNTNANTTLEKINRQLEELKRELQNMNKEIKELRTGKQPEQRRNAPNNITEDNSGTRQTTAPAAGRTVSRQTPTQTQTDTETEEEWRTQRRSTRQDRNKKTYADVTGQNTAKSPKTGSPLWRRDMGRKSKRDKTKTRTGRGNEEKPPNIHQVVPNNTNSRTASAGRTIITDGREPKAKHKDRPHSNIEHLQTTNKHTRQRNGKRIHIDSTLKTDGKAAIGIHYEDADDYKIRITDNTKIHTAETYTAIKTIQMTNMKQNGNITIITNRRKTAEMVNKGKMITKTITDLQKHIERHKKGWTTYVKWEKGHDKTNKQRRGS
ncbi:hypothetical protein HUJ04_011115 [Dendroctonus ponderosae]|nr:hypothetical protein HUJ04_011115 [Dendroctonus ponderosae]